MHALSTVTWNHEDAKVFLRCLRLLIDAKRNTLLRHAENLLPSILQSTVCLKSTYLHNFAPRHCWFHMQITHTFPSLWRSPYQHYLWSSCRACWWSQMIILTFWTRIRVKGSFLGTATAISRGGYKTFARWRYSWRILKYLKLQDI